MARRVRFMAALAALTLAVGILPTTVLADEPAQPIFAEGQAQINPAFSVSAEWIRHRLWVETEFDTDGDGSLDRMHVDVVRQAQTDTEGLKVPVIYETSPYYAGTASTNSAYFWNVNHEVGAVPPPRNHPPDITYQSGRTSVSNSEVNTWLPRGFAVVHSDSVGTGLSDGCPSVGGINESLAPKAVIDWLNGRAKGFSTRDGSEEVEAYWSTGKVGMTGTSYNGTLPLAAATTGVDGLDAIIPIAPNTSYYHYYRSNGLTRNPGGWVGEDVDYLFDYISSGLPANRPYCRATIRDDEMANNQDRASGDYNAFWAGRDYLNVVDNVKAATLMAHAFNDWNVVPEHSHRIAEALKANGVPVQEYYHQGGHGGAPPLVLRNRWFTRYLYGVENDVENDPKAWVTREAATCPPRTATVVGDQSNTATLVVADTSQLQIGMTLTVPQTNSTGTITNTTRVINSLPDGTTIVLASAVATAAGQKVADGTVVSIACSSANPTPYASWPVPGSAPVTVKLQEGGNAVGGLSSLVFADPVSETLVDDVSCNLGFNVANETPARLLYRTPELSAPLHISGTPSITLRVASSKAAANLSVALVRLPYTSSTSCTGSTIGTTTSVVTRAWADPQNHADPLGAGTPLIPGEFYDVTFDLQPDDQILPAGTRLGLIIQSSDREFTIRPQPGTELTVDLAGTAVQLPVVGGPLAMPICPDPDTRSTVFIGTTDTKVPNHGLAGTCTINDHIQDDQPWTDHGDFVDHVAEIGDLLVEAGLISGRERAAIVRAAAQSGIGK